MKLGRLLLRLTVGGFFIGHGTQKLFGWFGGNGLEATAGMFESLGLRPGKRHATAAGVAEAGGGALVLTGTATPLASSALIATMLTAINRVHLKNGPWITNGGYEYNAVLIAAAVILAEVGPGSPSVDSALGIEKSGAKWGALALALGVLGAVGAHLVAEAEGGPEPDLDAAQAAHAGGEDTVTAADDGADSPVAVDATADSPDADTVTGH